MKYSFLLLILLSTPAWSDRDCRDLLSNATPGQAGVFKSYPQTHVRARIQFPLAEADAYPELVINLRAACDKKGVQVELNNFRRLRVSFSASTRNAKAVFVVSGAFADIQEVLNSVVAVPFEAKVLRILESKVSETEMLRIHSDLKQKIGKIPGYRGIGIGQVSGETGIHILVGTKEDIGNFEQTILEELINGLPLPIAYIVVGNINS